jgi:hypothetical protein
MGRKRKQRQTINFPTQDTTDAELNAVVDGERVSTSSADHWKQDAEEKGKQVAAVANIPEIFTPDQVSFIFDILAIVLSFIYSQLLKYDFKVIHQELSFEPDQKERLSIPLARICSKYAPSEWAGMTAEIELICVLGVWAVSGFGRAKQSVEKDKREKMHAAEQHRRNPVTQVPQQQQEEVGAIPL